MSSDQRKEGQVMFLENDGFREQWKHGDGIRSSKTGCFHVYRLWLILVVEIKGTNWQCRQSAECSQSMALQTTKHMLFLKSLYLFNSSCFYWTQTFITVFTRDRHSTLTSNSSEQSVSPYLIPLRYIFIVSSNSHQNLPKLCVYKAVCRNWGSYSSLQEAAV